MNSLVNSKEEEITMVRLTRIEKGRAVRNCQYPENWVGEIPCYGCADRSNCDRDILEKLARYENTGLEPEQIKHIEIESDIPIGSTVYVIAKYTPRCNYELIECIVTNITSRKSISRMSVSGKWSNGQSYRASFAMSALNMKVFNNKDAAESCINNIRNNGGIHI